MSLTRRTTLLACGAALVSGPAGAQQPTKLTLGTQFRSQLPKWNRVIGVANDLFDLAAFDRRSGTQRQRDAFEPVNQLEFSQDGRRSLRDPLGAEGRERQRMVIHQGDGKSTVAQDPSRDRTSDSATDNHDVKISSRAVEHTEM